MSLPTPAAATALADHPADSNAHHGGGERSLLPTVLAVALGSAITLVFRGYQFGGSNHTVYLLDALRRRSPDLLANDWYTTQTLQYHAIFGELTAVLMRWGILEPGFLIGYLALVVLLHVGWRRLASLLLVPSPLKGERVRVRGFSTARVPREGTSTVLNPAPLPSPLKGARVNAAYLASVVLYYLLAGGTGLGMYQFLQDACFLPSNIANVAMLWFIVCWIGNRRGWAGAWLGLAGLFHLNHAVVGIGLWTVLSAWSWWDRRAAAPGEGEAPAEPDASDARDDRLGRSLALPEKPFGLSYMIGTLLGVGLPLVNILLAMRVLASRSGSLPLEPFVELYVRLRHPHHYDPSTWPAALWLCFLLPIPFALAAWARSSHGEIWGRRIFLVFLGLQLVALVGAGLWYVNESLIQMSLWRFSIYVKLLSCIGAVQFFAQAAWFRRGHATLVAFGVLAGIGALGMAAFAAAEGSVLLRHRMVIVVLLIVYAMIVLFPLVQHSWRPVVASALVVALLATAWGRWLGVQVIPADDAEYLAMCRWARENTSVDAVVLVPPDEQSFRLHAQRAIVVNFKGVPQLSGEIPGWRDRLDDVLNLDIRTLAGGSFPDTLRSIRQRYDALSEPQLLAAAGKYGATYLVTTRRFPTDEHLTLLHDVNGRYFMYHLVD